MNKIRTPGLVLMYVVLAVNLLGDWLRDVLGPRTKRMADYVLRTTLRSIDVQKKIREP